MVGFVVVTLVYGLCVFSPLYQRLGRRLPKRIRKDKSVRYVFAGTRSEFNAYCLEKGLDPERTRFVTCFNDLSPMNEYKKVVCVGTYYYDASFLETLKNLHRRNRIRLKYE